MYLQTFLVYLSRLAKEKGQDTPSIHYCNTKYKSSPSSVRSEGGEEAAGYCLNSVSYRVDEAVKNNVLNSD